MRTPLTVLLVLAFLAGALWAGRTAGSMLRRRVPGSAPAVGRPWPDELAKALVAMDRGTREDARAAWDAASPAAREGPAGELVAAWLAQDLGRLEALIERGRPPSVAARAAIEAIRLRERGGTVDTAGRAAFLRTWPATWWDPTPGAR
ncbi:MAG: hypothetical protein H6806_11135 [Planctomycetes bacterium]|nr:hypothetical protein [Planctomycetota bacterium]MCB9824914.1 hypothetical protein [Planctomycetota bacterium]MCB9830299.1 hypothetical protein [Planctomycetota bacterium]MCB9902183.1 hypothetical protein [Planctomycetota bacterium]